MLLLFRWDRPETVGAASRDIPRCSFASWCDGENKMTCRSKRYVKEVQLNDVIFFPLTQKKKKSDTDR